MENLTAEDVQKIQAIQSGTAQPAAQAAVETQTADQGAPAATTAAATTEEENEYVDLSSLGFESMNDLHERLRRAEELERQNQELSEYKAGPKFASDRQKFLYDFANRFEGMELPAARQLLEVVDLDLKTLPDQQIRFEAFKLNPANKGLSQDEMYKLFAYQEGELFGNPQDDVTPQTDVQKIKARQATATAREQLAKMQTDWNASKKEVKSPEEIALERQEYQQFLNQQITGFEGIQLKLQAQDEKGEKLEGAMNFKLDPVKQRQAVVAALQDPAGWWDQKLEQLGIMSANQTVPDFMKFADLVARIEFMDDLMNMTYKQGLEDQLARQLKGARNVADPAKQAGGITEPPKVSEQKEMVREAMKVAGMV